MRALVVLNPGSGSLAKLGIDRRRERVEASCKANNLVATIALAPGSGISEPNAVAITNGSTAPSTAPRSVAKKATNTICVQ